MSNATEPANPLLSPEWQRVYDAVEPLLRFDAEDFRLALADELHAVGAPLLRTDVIAAALYRAAMHGWNSGANDISA